MPKESNNIPAQMRAAVLTGHGGLEVIEYRTNVPVPTPKADEVLVRVGACGVNNTDINTRTAWYNRDVAAELSEEFGVKGRSDTSTSTASSWNTGSVTFPRISGAATVGYIAAVGAEVDGGRVGERVIVDPCVRDPKAPLRAQLVEYVGSERDGGFAEYMTIPSINAHSIESPMTDAELATFPCSYDTAEEMLERARLGEGETVLITGAAGGVGTALIQLAHIRGAKVIAVAGASKESRIRKQGVEHFIPRETTDLLAVVEELVGSRAVDVVADVVGGPSFGGLLKMLTRGGRYTTAGAIAGPVQTIDLRDLIYKDLELYGITCPTASTFKRVVDLIAAGKLAPMLESEFPLESLADAQAELVKRQHVGKFAVVPKG
ncbi:NADPH:quinone reductase [Arthrobacter sp. 49Tsu3.1M3]|uniref:alcohol dehydrogenase family protein n=1 Tax=Arthrobacter sp. 49Tsu3.1M3 TaxID=1279029 RepID=UPI0009A830DC|nr:alcohol dehydrogenase family protein [Arthrobacter sp. 49Tsu3.1M3]SKB43825.1 NADPH:quinone reductase [Arthrobacter sp. 49Tsu3.1M3]